MNYLAERLDDYGKGAWIGVMVLGFIAYWPIGLAILGFLMFSGRMRAWREAREVGPGRWYSADMPSCGSLREMRRAARRARRGQFAYAPSSGNEAFDEYRSETLRRLEEEQREFVEYLERLRKAKDRQEFEQFMAERNRRPNPNGNPPVDNV